MGHAADMLRQRKILHKKKAEERSKRSDFEKSKRRTDDTTGASATATKERQVTKSFAAAPLPTPEQEKQLVGKIYQSLRVPEAADALGALIRHLAQKIFALEANPITKSGKELIGSKRGRDEAAEEVSKKPLVKRLQAIVNGICTVGDDEDEGNDKLAAIIKDEVSNRVLCALLRAIYAHHDSHAEESEESTTATSAKNNKVDAATIKLLKPVTEAADHLVELILYLFSAGMIPEDQHTVMRVLVVIADFGNDAQKTKVLKYIKKKVKRADAAAAAAAEAEAEEDKKKALEADDTAATEETKAAKKAAAAEKAGNRTVSSVLLDRHIANVVLKLLAGNFRDQTVAWLNNQLLAIVTEGEASNTTRVITPKQLINLVEDNVAGNVLQAWVHDSNREFLFFNVLSQPSNLSALIKSRRGCRFLAQLLTAAAPATEVSKAQSALATKMLKRMMNPALAADEASADSNAAEAATNAVTPVITKKLDIVNMSIDMEANYVAQRVYALLPAVAAHNGTEALLVYKKILDLFDNHTPAPQAPKKAPKLQFTDTQQARKEKGYLQHVGGYHNKISTVEVTTGYIELAVSSIGCHSLIALLEGAVGAAAYPTCKIDLNLLIDRVFKTSQAQALMADQHGSLVLRKFIAALGAAAKQADKTSPITAAFNTVVSVVESHIKELMYDQAGNIVVQQLLAALPPAQVASFYTRYIQKSVFEIASHPSAAHVLVALLDIVDAKVHADIAQQVKSNILQLATHLNGRFVVEKLIPNYSDIRETIATNFGKLAKEKGTQHVLVALWNAIDDNKTKQLIEKTIMPNLNNYAVDACSSIVIQKLLQDSQKRDPESAKGALCKLARAAVVDNAAVKKQLIHDRFGRFIVWVLDSSSQPDLTPKAE